MSPKRPGEPDGEQRQECAQSGRRGDRDAGREREHERERLIQRESSVR